MHRSLTRLALFTVAIGGIDLVDARPQPEPDTTPAPPLQPRPAAKRPGLDLVSLPSGGSIKAPRGWTVNLRGVSGSIDAPKIPGWAPTALRVGFELDVPSTGKRATPTHTITYYYPDAKQVVINGWVCAERLESNPPGNSSIGTCAKVLRDGVLTVTLESLDYKALGGLSLVAEVAASATGLQETAESGRAFRSFGIAECDQIIVKALNCQLQLPYDSENLREVAALKTARDKWAEQARRAGGVGQVRQACAADTSIRNAAESSTKCDWAKVKSDRLIVLPVNRNHRWSN